MVRHALSIKSIYKSKSKIVKRFYVSSNVDEVIFWLFRFPVLSYSVDPIIELACLTNGPVPNSDNCYHLIES